MEGRRPPTFGKPTAGKLSAAGTNATDHPGLHEERLRRDADTLEGVEVLNNFAYATNNAGEGI